MLQAGTRSPARRNSVLQNCPLTADKPRMRTRMVSRRRIVGVTLAAVAGVIVFFLTVKYFPKPWPELSRQELIDEVQGGYVHEVVVTGGKVLTGVSSRSGPFRVPLRRGDHSLADELSA